MSKPNGDGWDDLLEKLASCEHDSWAHWQKYLHSKCSKRPDGSLIIPANLVAKWESQISRGYSQLTEDEKESDREQVRKYLPIIASFMEEHVK